MKGRIISAAKDGVPKRRWPERANRAVVAFAVVAEGYFSRVPALYKADTMFRATFSCTTTPSRC